MIGFSIASSSDYPSEVPDSAPYLEMSTGPEESILLGYSHPLGICLDCEHIVNSYIIKADQQSCRRDLLQRAKKMKSMSQEMYNAVSSEQIESFLKESESVDMLLVYTRTSILAWGHGKESEDTISQKLQRVLSGMNICASRVLKTLPEEFLHSIPGNEMDFSKDDYLLGEASSATCLLAWESYEKGLCQGNLQVSERLSSRPINLDLASEAYMKGWINAYNAFVLGPTGSGKSFFMNHYLRCCHDRGAKICVLDNGKSYEGLSALIREENGLARKSSKKRREDSLEFNPFAGFIKEGK